MKRVQKCLILSIEVRGAKPLISLAVDVHFYFNVE
nr:MAG TPA: hypothetical protein [Caudoviricetes sp.]